VRRREPRADPDPHPHPDAKARHRLRCARRPRPAAWPGGRSRDVWHSIDERDKMWRARKVGAASASRRGT
ncbi:MAG: hypothetical protein KDB21_10280, partial [Acidimicrobiales bacterium]|nr:hypothetical protein [Acidimicrobiales bacterium]